MQAVLRILLFSSIAVTYLFVMAKLLGKKQIAQLDVIDYMLGIAVSSIAAEMATDMSDTPFWHYLVAMTFFFVLNLLIIFLERKGRFIKKFLKGVPLMVIYEGQINYKALKKSKMDINDLISKSREKGYFDLSDIEYAVFENSGALSIMPKGLLKPVVVEDIETVTPKPAKLPCYLVDDGNITYSTLQVIGKNVSWLYQKLNITTKTELKNIILAVYDQERDVIAVSKKK
ncbi:MAG: DUF421 domain-containing protein [Firmicutes bacterium]|nr:DUF421 domain-containing protein [Bacillota bacterium]